MHILDGVNHYYDVIMGMIASQITSLTIVYLSVYSDADQRKHQSSASLAFVWGIHRGPVNSPHKWPVTRKMFPFDDVIMYWQTLLFPVVTQRLHITVFTFIQPPEIILWTEFNRLDFLSYTTIKQNGQFQKIYISMCVSAIPIGYSCRVKRLGLKL